MDSTQVFSGPPPSHGSTSTSFLERLKRQDAQAWQRLVELYGPLIYQWCRQCGLQSQDSADVAQEVFSAVVRGVGDFQRDRPGDSFRGWLWTITRNKIRDQARRRQGEAQARGGTTAAVQLASLPSELATGGDATGASSDGQRLGSSALATIRDRFEDRTWQAFWRTTVGHEAGIDVAADLGMTVQAVYQAKYRVLNTIRDELGDLLT